ncbi:MAG TPA: M23 family metallopeptidase [Gemmatimonadaceae bacterium]
MARKKKQTPTGYGNIYTPHAGSMIIQVQRESGLANRTIVLSPRQVKLMRWLFSRRGAAVATLFGVSWLFFAVQAARVPSLTGRIDEMRYESSRIDTLQVALDELTKRYAQVQTMLSSPGQNARASREASPGEPAAVPRAEPRTSAAATRSAPTSTTTPPTAARATAPGTSAPSLAAPVAAAPKEIVPTVPSRWPLPVAGYLTRGTLGEGPYNGPHPGIDVAVPEGTEIRAAGAGSVVEVGENEEYGKFLRLSHADGYETLYAHASRVLVARGQTVDAGAAIAHSGNTGRSTAPHLHFEVRRAGATIDPLQLIKQGQ